MLTQPKTFRRVFPALVLAMVVSATRLTPSVVDADATSAAPRGGTTLTDDVYEPDDTSVDATPIFPFEIQADHDLEDGLEADWFTFTLADRSFVTVEVSAEARTMVGESICIVGTVAAQVPPQFLTMSIWPLNGSGQTVGGSLATTAPGDPLTLTLNAGTYGVELTSGNGDPLCGYAIHLMTEIAEADLGNDTASAAEPISIPHESTPRSLTPGDPDWYSFDLAATTDVVISMGVGFSGPAPALFNGLATSPQPVAGSYSSEGSHFFIDLAPDTYYLRVDYTVAVGPASYAFALPSYSIDVRVAGEADAYEVDDDIQFATIPPANRNLFDSRQLHNFHDAGDVDWIDITFTSVGCAPCLLNFVEITPIGAAAQPIIEVFDSALNFVFRATGPATVTKCDLGLADFQGGRFYARIFDAAPTNAGPGTEYSVKLKLSDCTNGAIGIIKGTVFDRQTGLPIAGAIVAYSSGFRSSNVTAANGKYEIQQVELPTGPPPMNRALVVEAPGYIHQYGNVTLYQSITSYTLNFFLDFGIDVAVDTNELFFGLAPIGDVVPLQVQLTNSTGSALSNWSTSVNSSGVFALTEYCAPPAGPCFPMTSGGAFTLAAGQTAAFTLEFAPTLQSAYSGTFTFPGTQMHGVDLFGVGIDRNDVWVDFDYVGLELGLGTQPYNSLSEGAAEVNPGGTVHVYQGSSSAPAVLGLTKGFTLEAADGLVRLGQSGG